MNSIGRREFVASAAGGVAWPLAARAQQRALPLIGYLTSGRGGTAGPFAAFRQALSAQGYVEGHNLAIVYRSADGRNDQLPKMAADLVSSQVAIIYANGAGSALAAKSATATIPIVFGTGGDPVEIGLVASLNRPGGNVTGVYWLAQVLIGKRLQLLYEIVPSARSIGLLADPTDANSEAETREAGNGARSLGLQLAILNASTAAGIDAAFANLVEQRIAALMVSFNALFLGQIDQIVALAARHSVPAIYSSREAVEAGGLMSYGTDTAEPYRMVATHISRILKGEKPADLPAQQSTRTESVLNLKTAKALGLTLPRSMLILADEVIE